MAGQPAPTNLTDLPTDVLLLIAPYLNPSEFLAFCSITSDFYNDTELRYASSYWSTAIRDTFRVPNQPVVQGDGQRWMRLYRRMRTQTRIYGWGNDDGECLGGDPVRVPTSPMTRVHLHRFRRDWVTWPRELRKGNTGVIADMQCGGWSTTMLDSKGSLYTTGILDGLNSQLPCPTPVKLTYPPGFTPPGVGRYDPYTAIKQFSSGRSHVLGLSDIGRIWSWDHVHRHGLHVKFLLTDLVEGSTEDLWYTTGHVRKVVAGWNLSTAYITGTGIMTWQPSNNAEIQGYSDQSTGDGMLMLEAWVVPDSRYLQPRKSIKTELDGSTKAQLENVGEVVSYAVLAQYVLFVTHLGKVFASKIPYGDITTTETVQLVPCLAAPGPASPEVFAIDVQGSYTSFAIFKRNGEVLKGDQDYLNAAWDHRMHAASTRWPKLRKIPCLQQTGVISMAFGDYHYHALHSDGHISSYGHEPKGCGALGLRGPCGSLRGLTAGAPVGPFGFTNTDRWLVEKCYTTGRRVAFEAEKRDWLAHMHGEARDARDVEEARERTTMLHSREDVRAEVSEWIEQRLTKWDDGPVHSRKVGHSATEPQHSHDPTDDGLPPYFALSVAAGGHHSGALVLVNDDKARRTRERYIRPRPTLWDSTLTFLTSAVNGLRETLGSDSNSTDSPAEAGTAPGTGASDSDATTGISLDGDALPMPATAAVKDAAGCWAWEAETFPRLRLSSGEVLPGTVPVVEWEGPPEWRGVEDVDE